MKNLLVAIDFSDVTGRVITNAEEMGLALGAKVWLMHCVRESAGADSKPDGRVARSRPMRLAERFPKQYERIDGIGSIAAA